MLRKIYLGFSDSSSSRLRCKSSVECSCVGGKGGKCDRFSKTGGQVCADQLSFVHVGMQWFLECPACEEHQKEKKPKTSRRTCPIAKSTKPLLFFNSKALCSSVSFFYFSNPYIFISQGTNDLIILFPQVISSTPVLCCGWKTRRGRKWRIHFSCYFSENFL